MAFIEDNAAPRILYPKNGSNALIAFLEYLEYSFNRYIRKYETSLFILIFFDFESFSRSSTNLENCN